MGACSSASVCFQPLPFLGFQAEQCVVILSTSAFPWLPGTGRVLKQITNGQARQSHIANIAPLVFKMAQDLDLRCVFGSSALGALGQNTSPTQNKEAYTTLYLYFQCATQIQGTRCLRNGIPTPQASSTQTASQGASTRLDSY